jgi:CelD/BcsL family acetyltransferase involved in cellulose biosynthesis
MQVRILQNISSIEPLLGEWDELWSRCPQATPFQRPEWMFSWMQVFQPREPLLVEFRRDGALVGLAPLLIYESGSDRVLAFMGGGVSDYLDVLFDPAVTAEAVQLFWDLVLQLGNGEHAWNTLNLTDVPGASCLLVHTGRQWPERIDNACPILTLPAAKDSKPAIPFRQLRNLKNARNRLGRAGGGEIEVAGRETLESLLSSVFRLHGRRWQNVGQCGVVSDNTVQRFHRKVAPLLLEKGILRIYGLRVRQQYIASLYTLFGSEAAYCYLQGFDPDFAWFSPGTQIIGAAIEDAVKEGKRKVDFLRGREAYKYHWGTQDEPTFRIHASSSSLLSAWRLAA